MVHIVLSQIALLGATDTKILPFAAENMPDHEVVREPTENNSNGVEPTKESRKGKNSLEKQYTRKGGKGPEKGSRTGERPKEPQAAGPSMMVDLAPKTTLANDVEDIKKQLAGITGSLATIAPVINEIKTAYDNYNQAVDEELLESDTDSIQSAKDNNNGGHQSEEGEIHEPPKKKPKRELIGVLADMAKMVNKPLNNGDDLDSDLSELLTELLSKGASKDSRDDLIDKLPTPGNCQRLEVVRVNPEIFNSVRKEVKTDDVMLQKAQKPLLKGITAVANVLTDFMTAEKDKNIPTEMADLLKKSMQTLSDSLSLLSDASHEIDLRRRSLFKSDMKSEYRLLCSDQSPVKELLFGTELGKSVKDLTEASKVTSKITSKPNKNKRQSYNYSSQHGRPDQKRSFPFLSQGRGYAGRQKSGQAYRHAQKGQTQYQPRK